MIFASVDVEGVLLLLKASFLVLLYVFIWRIVRTASRDLRLPQESFVLGPQQAAALGLGSEPELNMGRLVVLKSDAIDENTEFELDSKGISIGRGNPNDVRLDADEYASATPRTGRASPRRRLDRGHRVDERHVRERGAPLEAAEAGRRRPRPRRRHGPEVRGMTVLGRSTGLSHPGRKRRRNEDAWVCNAPLFAVADGMGGARGGEIASRVAATALGESVDGSGESRVVALIQEANRQVYERAREDSDASGMGTTITVALFENGIVSIGHVGDSRAYLIRDRKVDQLTEDHSLVAELVRSGRLSPEEAVTHPQRSVITRALGTDPDVDVDAFSVEAKPGDLFLICSDGLTAMVDDATILDVVERQRDDLDAAAKELIAAANRNGGEDNITVVFFEVVEEGAQKPSDTTPMPALGEEPEPAEKSDEDTLTEADGVPAVDTMVVPPEQARELLAEKEPEVPKERLSVQAARVVVGLAVVAGLALLVYWLLGQSQ